MNRAVVRVLRMVGREMLGEGFLEIGSAGNPRFAFLVIGARLIVEVTRAGDIGVLQGIGPGPELPGATLGN